MRSKDTIKYCLGIVLIFMIGTNIYNLVNRFQPHIYNLQFDKFVSVNERVEIYFSTFSSCSHIESYTLSYNNEIQEVKILIWALPNQGVCLLQPREQWYRIFIVLPKLGIWKVICNNLDGYITVL